MPVVRRIRKRNASITVEANAEILFMPGGPVHNWTNRFTGQIRSKTIQAAPTNIRPRWKHYGKPLKATIVSARPRFWSNGRDKQRVYAAVGSTAPYAHYVDQGTGIYAGRSPYQAKVLPPWSEGDASLYEHTWSPGGPQGRKVAPVFIKGQRGQRFFDKGLRLAFQHMRMRSYQVPADPRAGEVLRSVPSDLLTGPGNTPSDEAFKESLREWRKWRDRAIADGQSLNRSRYNAAAVAKKAAAKTKKADKPRRKSPVVNPQQRRADRAKFLAAKLKQYGKIDKDSLEYRDGYWYLVVWGTDKKGRKTWVEIRAKAKS